MAAAAGILDRLALAATVGAGLLHREETLLHPDLARTATGSTAHRRTAAPRAAAVAFAAGLQRGHANLDRGAVDGVFQVDFEVVAQVGAALRAGAPAAPPATTEDIAEHIAEDVAEARAAATEAAGAGLRVDPGMTELVVRRLLLRVRQHRVGLVGLLEALLGGLVARVAVRVVLHRDAAIGLLDLGLVRATLDAQYIVVISFRHLQFPIWLCALGLCQHHVGLKANLQRIQSAHPISASNVRLKPGPQVRESQRGRSPALARVSNRLRCRSGFSRTNVRPSQTRHGRRTSRTACPTGSRHLPRG